MSDPATIQHRMEQLRLVPVIRIEDAARAAPLGQALLDGGLPCAEVTFRTDAAPEAIEAMARMDELLVGAGTVVSRQQVDTAVDAGARFVVSPGLDAGVVRRCQELSVPVFPGVATPSEIMQAVALDLSVLKLFPAGALGGRDYLDSVAAPFPEVRFIPTGGVNAENVGDWLAHPRVLACGGSWMVPGDALRSGEYDRIRDLVAEAVASGRS